MWKTLTIIAILLAATGATLRYFSTSTAKLETKLLQRSIANLAAAETHLGNVVKSRQKAEAQADAIGAIAAKKQAIFDPANKQKSDKEAEKKLIAVQIIEKKEKLTLLENQLKEIGDIEAAVTKSESLQIEMASVRQELAIANETFKNQLLSREATKQRIADIKAKETMQVSGQMLSINARISQNHSQWNFVVISAGGRQGVNAHTKLDVVRGGRLIGKLKVTTLETNQSVCDVISVNAGESIATGDRVVVASDSKWDPSAKVATTEEAVPVPDAEAAAPAETTPDAPVVPEANGDDPFGLDPTPAVETETETEVEATDPFG